MTKVFEGNLVLEKDSVFEEGIEVKGNIVGKNDEKFNLTVKGDINALDINAGNINALDINAGNINALDINAGNIEYHAVCFAYKNIECKSIKGKRKNAKHFCLDGKITIKEKQGGGKQK